MTEREELIGKYQMSAIKRWWIPDWFLALAILAFGGRLVAKQPLRWVLFEELR